MSWKLNANIYVKKENNDIKKRSLRANEIRKSMNEIETGGEERRGKRSEMLCITFLHNKVICNGKIRGISVKYEMKFISLFLKYL